MDFIKFYFENMPYVLVMAYVIDSIIGDPVYRLHPVRIVGKFIYFVQKQLFNLKLTGFFGGAILLFLSLFVFVSLYAILTAFIFKLSFATYKIYELLFFIVNVYITYSLIAGKDLDKHSSIVCNNLKNNEIEKARKNLSMIVGRDTDSLNESEISTAVVETIAENSSDGVIAPIFYFAFLGPLGMIFYKVVNTLDSMIGYKNEKFIKFGFFSAKFDDLLNFIPARVTMILILLLSTLKPSIYKTAFKYRNAHSSPNSGYPESAVAALLNLGLGGDSSYFGNVVSKPKINPNGRLATIYDIDKASSVLFRISLFFTLCVAILQYLFISKVFVR